MTTETAAQARAALEAEGRTPCRIEWMDDDRPWTRHSADWYGSRVPSPGEYISVPPGVSKKVKLVMWALDATCVVRLEDHPR